MKTIPVGHKDILDPTRWGLPAAVVDELAERLLAFWQRYRACFWTRTSDQSAHAYAYLSGLLRLRADRSFAAIGREWQLPGENIQHFMSNSPWPAEAVFQRIQADIVATPALQQGGALILDESADAKAGRHSAGTARQRNGRLGKVERCQVGVFLTYAQDRTWTWVDAELFWPEVWFTPEYTAKRQAVGLPRGQGFHTKVELGWQMIQRARQRGLPFELVACDALYGRAHWFRARLAQARLTYMVQVPRNMQVYLEQPAGGGPAPVPGSRGRPAQPPRVLPPAQPLTVAEVAQREDTAWHTVEVRPTERGFLVAPYAARRVWTRRDGRPTAEWLVLRQDMAGELHYALGNAAADTPLSKLAWQESHRYFVERAIQDAKSELGWAEFQAQKYRAWAHQAALTALGAWFVAQIKLDWSQRYPPDPTLAAELASDLLPGLSVANVRELLRVALPLRQLTPAAARRLVVQHLLQRTRARQSRLRRQQQDQAPPRTRSPG